MAKAEDLRFPDYHQHTQITITEAFNQDTSDKHTIDTIAFYKALEQLWQPNTIAFEDICMAYRDRQAICKQPAQHCRIFTANQGSSMGSAFGLAVGAATADSSHKTFAFIGDGGFHFIVGGLSETAQLNLTLFLFDNATLGLVELFPLEKIEKQPVYKHTKLAPIDWKKVGEGMGWRVDYLTPNCDNLKSLMKEAYSQNNQSNLIIVPADPHIAIGKNFRYEQLQDQ
jgi:acetolactate synthase-1/2/3 large subunit